MTRIPGPHHTQLYPRLGPEDADEAARLAGAEIWNQGVPHERIARSHVGSTAWVGARDPEGQLIATARAISDGAKFAWVYDVVVAEAWRGKGVGDAVFRLLLADPALRDCMAVHLQTKDAAGFYEKLGFVERSRGPQKPWRSFDMSLWQVAPPYAAWSSETASLTANSASGTSGIASGSSSRTSRIRPNTS